MFTTMMMRKPKKSQKKIINCLAVMLCQFTIMTL